MSRGMLIAVIADTHLPRGPRKLPERCLEHLREAELILHAGDVSTVGVLDELSALGPRHSRWQIDKAKRQSGQLVT